MHINYLDIGIKYPLLYKKDNKKPYFKSLYDLRKNRNRLELPDFPIDCIKSADRLKVNTYSLSEKEAYCICKFYIDRNYEAIRFIDWLDTVKIEIAGVEDSILLEVRDYILGKSNICWYKLFFSNRILFIQLKEEKVRVNYRIDKYYNLFITYLEDLVK